MAHGLETINISKASTLTNLFYLFFHGGKAAIMPFLTLFFRLIGLNAFEVGIIIAAKTVTGLIWAPLWSRCATAYNRHRSVIMFSLFMLVATYLSLPALYTQISKPEHCLPQRVTDNASLKQPEYTTDLQSIASTQKTDVLMTTSATTKSPVLENVTTLIIDSTSTGSSVFFNTTGVFNLTNSSEAEMDKSPRAVTELILASTTANDLSVFLKRYPSILSHLNLTAEDFKEFNFSYTDLLEFLNIRANYSSDLSEDELQELGQETPSEATSDETIEAIHKRLKRNDWTDLELLKEKFHTIRSSLQTDKLLLFLVILAIVVVGEIFASPVEKLADDSWFDFLNRIDDLERYGQQRFWGSIAFVFVPVIVTVAVDYSPCFLFDQVHHFLIHFFIFAVLMFSAWLVACCYPSPPPANGRNSSKLCKGLNLVCCDGRGFLFSFTLLFTGLVYASYHNFLFWRIQDLGGRETVMGLCVSIAAFAEIPMLILSSHLVKRLGPIWLVSLSLLVLSLRVLFYAFNTEPWAFLPAELSHGLTHTSMWFAILSYEDFNLGLSIDRSLRTILSSFYFGIGFSSGSLISGFIFHSYGSSFLFWSSSALIGGWCILFTLIQKCLPKKQNVKYIKLLKSESDNSDDEEEDWLEMALKDH
uniref:Major facilitator superfamily associated domain-containing protein n=1 Tax=Biomphalaria glabrata TaxID=6526 RepID=A0A2C9LW78_BIOGL